MLLCDLFSPGPLVEFPPGSKPLRIACSPCPSVTTTFNAVYLFLSAILVPAPLSFPSAAQT
jgi:hypothetical protein